MLIGTFKGHLVQHPLQGAGTSSIWTSPNKKSISIFLYTFFKYLRTTITTPCSFLSSRLQNTAKVTIKVKKWTSSQADSLWRIQNKVKIILAPADLHISIYPYMIRLLQGFKDVMSESEASCRSGVLHQMKLMCLVLWKPYKVTGDVLNYLLK